MTVLYVVLNEQVFGCRFKFGLIQLTAVLSPASLYQASKHAGYLKVTFIFFRVHLQLQDTSHSWMLLSKLASTSTCILYGLYSSWTPQLYGELYKPLSMQRLPWCYTST